MQKNEVGSLSYTIYTNYLKINFKKISDFPDDPLVRNPPANAVDMDLVPGPGGSDMPWDN